MKGLTRASKTVAASLVLVAATLASTGAQAPGSPQSPQVPPRTPDVVPPAPEGPTSRPRIDLPDLGRKETDESRLSRVSGCLVLSTRAERFLLAQAQVETSPSEPVAASGSRGPNADAPRPTYRLKGLEPERLRPFLNQRVLVRGTLEREGTRPPVSPSDAGKRPEETWLELDAVSISELSGTCAAP